MKATKLLPILAVVLCVPGIALRALHLLNGFDVSTGLPTAGDKWIWFVIALFAISAIVYAVLALPLKTRNKVPFEQLLGTKEALFRMAAVVAGLIVAAGSLGYLYLTITTAEQDAAAWARVLEIVYAIMGVLTGGCMIGLAKAQGVQMTEKGAAMTLVPLFWSCLHLLVNYRMTCTDPKLASFGFGLVADVMIVLAFYELARLLFGKPAMFSKASRFWVAGSGYAGVLCRSGGHHVGVGYRRLRSGYADGHSVHVVDQNGAARHSGCSSVRYAGC